MTPSYNNDAAAAVTAGTGTAGSVSYAGSALTWTGDLAVGASVVITFSVTVKDPDTGDKILVNSVTSAAAGGNCPAGSTDARCTATVSVLVPGLQITASAGSSTTAPGSVVHYTVTVTNSGQTPYTGAGFTDPLAGVLDDAAYNNDATAAVTAGTGTAGTVSYASPDLAWTGDLTVGQTVTITYTVTVHNPDTGGKLMVNFVTSTDPGSSCPSDSPSPGCTVTVPVLTQALTITRPPARPPPLCWSPP